MDWQPIETARKHDRQKDGSTNQPHVIGTDGKRVGEVRHFDFYWYWVDGGDTCDPPLTHWQPLPDPPAAD